MSLYAHYAAIVLFVVAPLYGLSADLGHVAMFVVSFWLGNRIALRFPVGA